MENNLMIKTEMFGYSKADVEQYISRLNSGFAEKLAEQEKNYKSLLEKADAEKVKLVEEYEAKLTSLKEENANLASAFENLLNSSSPVPQSGIQIKNESESDPDMTRKREIAEAMKTFAGSEEKKPELEDDDFNRIISAISNSDESLLNDSDLSFAEFIDEPVLNEDSAESFHEVNPGFEFAQPEPASEINQDIIGRFDTYSQVDRIEDLLEAVYEIRDILKKASGQE